MKFIEGAHDDRYKNEKEEITEEELRRIQNQESIANAQTADNKSKQQTLNFFKCERKKSASTTTQSKISVRSCGNFKLHHLSLLNDPTLKPRRLEADENIFEIIMPWLEEQRQENKQKCEELFDLKLIDKTELNKRIGATRKEKGRDQKFKQEKLFSSKPALEVPDNSQEDDKTASSTVEKQNLQKTQD